MNNQERLGFGALAIGAILPWPWFPLILVSALLIMVAIVFGVLALARRRFWQGFLLLLLWPVAAFIAYAGMELKFAHH
jgi:hypothetical protein